MTALKLVGWEKGIKTVSLINAICEYTGSSLSQAKSLVEELLAGKAITIEFADDATMKAFRSRAISFGTRCQ